MTLKQNNSELENVEQEVQEILEQNTEESFLAQEVKRLQNELLLVLADADNARKRHEKQLQDTKDYAITEFAKEMVRVLDNMNMALAHQPQEIDEASKNVILGVQMTQGELIKIFTKYGITEVFPKIGDHFDSQVHYAISREETDKHPTNTIVSVVQMGYKLKDRLLRPAMVVVAHQN